MAKPFRGQVFETLQAQCVSSKNLFIDPLFKACGKSIFYSAEGMPEFKSQELEIEWLRPKVFFKLKFASRIFHMLS